MSRATGWATGAIVEGIVGAHDGQVAVETSARAAHPRWGAASAC